MTANRSENRFVEHRRRLEQLADELGTFEHVISLEELLRLRETDHDAHFERLPKLSGKNPPIKS